MNRNSGLGWEPRSFAVDIERRADGAVLIRPKDTLLPYPDRVTDELEQWAEATPRQTFVARRDFSGQWRRLSYADTLDRVRRLATGLMTLELTPERPLLILSGNSVEHLLLGLAAMYVGVPYCPVSPAYSHARSDLSKLRELIARLTPGLVAAFGRGHYGRAIERCVPAGIPLLRDEHGDEPGDEPGDGPGDELRLSGRRVLSLQALQDMGSSSVKAIKAALAAHHASGPETVAKYLLTSGSAGIPKAVITTQRMLCSNQVMLRQALPFVMSEPPVLVDWLPWNHTFGGSHNVGLALFNGGTLYVDDGRPMVGDFDTTVENLREISPTVYFNVPKGFDLLAQRLSQDEPLRENFYRRLRACFFAGAGLSQTTWDALDAQAIAARGEKIPMISGLGATETAPSVTFTVPGNERSGVIGLPAAGNVLKLIPEGGKFELRVQGPNVTPGYFRSAEQTATAFDEEGYYRLGDAVRFAQVDDPSAGLLFDGRIAEDFKLASGTWVSVGPLRVQLITALAPLALDVIVAGLNRDYVGVLIVPNPSACHAGGGDEQNLRRTIVNLLRSHALSHPGSSTAVRRALLLVEPLSLDGGEITDKGTVNQRRVLELRAQRVEDLYALEPAVNICVVE